MKDWQIANYVFGKNTKKECDFVKKYRKAVFSEMICDAEHDENKEYVVYSSWYHLQTKQEIEANEWGFIFPKEMLTES